MSHWIRHYITPTDDFDLIEKLKEDGHLTENGTIWNNIRGEYRICSHVLDLNNIAPELVEKWQKDYKDEATERDSFDEREYNDIGKWPVHVYDTIDEKKELKFGVNSAIHTDFLYGISILYPDKQFQIYVADEDGYVFDDGIIKNGNQNGNYVTKTGQSYDAAFLIKKSSVKFEDGIAYAKVPLRKAEPDAHSFFVTIKAPENLICEANDLGRKEKDSYDDYYAFLFDENHPSISMQRNVDVEGNLISKTPFIIYDYKGEERDMPFTKFEKMNYEARRSYAIQKNQIQIDIDPRDTEIIIKHQVNFDEELLKLKIKVPEEISENGEMTVLFGRSNFKGGWEENFFTRHPENKKFPFITDKDYEKNVSVKKDGHYETVRKKISEIRALYQAMNQERRNGLQSEESRELEEEQERE